MGLAPPLTAHVSPVKPRFLRRPQISPLLYILIFDDVPNQNTHLTRSLGVNDQVHVEE
jgi:hypothetical protein